MYVKQESPWVKLMGMRLAERHEYVVRKIISELKIEEIGHAYKDTF